MANGKFSDVEALAISDGGIVAAGSMNEAIRVTGIDVDIVDLKNRCILPGFIDPHVHLINTALIGNLFMDMSPSVVPNRDTAISMVETQAMEVMKRAKGEWVVGFGYDPSRVEGHLEIQKGDLDAVTRVKGVDVPVFIVNQSGHLAYMNSLALEIAAEKYNLDDDPYYRKDPDTDELTGVIAETAVNQIVTLVQKPSADDLATWCKQTWDSWARKGCTTVFDCGLGSTGPSDVPIVKAVSEKELMNVRMHGALAHYGVDSFADLLAAPPITTGKNSALTEPYIDGVGGTGVLNQSDDGIVSIMSKYLARGWQIIVHFNGDRATDQVLNAYESTFRANPDRNLSILYRIEHFTITTPEQIQRAKHLGIGVSQTMNHVYCWGPAFHDWVLGHKRASRIDHIRDDADADVIFSFHSDSPITDVEPLLTLRTAVTGAIQTGEVLGKEQRVDLETAVRGITCNPAKHVMMGNTVGTLELGKNADLVVLDKDPRTVDPDKLHLLEVQETWLEGRQTYGKSRLGVPKL